MTKDPTQGKSLEELYKEFPKIGMSIDYAMDHYRENAEKLMSNKLVMTAIQSPTYSNNQIEDIIDKIALFNSYPKWMLQS